FGPRKPVTRPGRTVKVRSSTARTGPKFFVRPRTSTTPSPSMALAGSAGTLIRDLPGSGAGAAPRWSGAGAGSRAKWSRPGRRGRSSGTFRARGTGRLHASRARGQGHAHRAAGRGVGDLDRPAVQRHGPAHDRQTQARPACGDLAGLGRVVAPREAVEDAL